MLDGAVQQYLKANGLVPVHVAGFGDYTTAGAPAYAVRVEAGADADHDGDMPRYPVRLQLRTRAANMPDALKAAEAAFVLILALNGQTIDWVDPRDDATRSYEVSGVRAVQRPTWFPTPEPGEETSCNFVARVMEV